MRKLTAALSPPRLSVTTTNDAVLLNWSAVPGRTYRVQSKAALSDSSWSDVAGDVVANAITATKTNIPGSQRFYRVVESPGP